MSITNYSYPASDVNKDHPVVTFEKGTGQSLIGKSLDEISDLLKQDYHLLDKPFSGAFDGKLIIGHEKSAVQEAYPSDVHLVKPPKVFSVLKLLPFLYDLVKSLWLLRSADEKTCIFINGGQRFGMLTCVLNSFLRKQRKIVLTYMYIPRGKVRRWLARRIILGSSLTAVWSRRQLEVQAKLLNLPVSKLIFMPYKALHSIRPPITLRIGNYVFSGGAKRDYQMLFDAIRDTGIPVIISVMNPKEYAHLKVPENVILLSSREPAFARLMAASRFVVIPILPDLVRGAGEASLCNAMWHGRPVICADEISAFEYIEEGVTGYVTPSGDAAKLRERIVELWNQPEKAEQMGRAAHQSVAENFSDEHFSRRLRALGILVATAK